MNIAICIAVALFVLQEVPKAGTYNIPGLGVIKLPDDEWELEKSHTPRTGSHAIVFKKGTNDLERITIVRFKKSQGNRGLTLEDSNGFCDLMGDSLYEGKPLLWGSSLKGVGSKSMQAGTNFMIRLPSKNAVEPLSVTNIYTSSQGRKWMNHGLIASNENYSFLLVHSSPKVITPDTIEDVYLTSPLPIWPKVDSQTAQNKNISARDVFQQHQKPKIEIFLVTNDSTVQKRSQETMWANGMNVFELEEKALIDDEEVVGYDWAKHELVLTATGYRKIPKVVPAEGVDFVVTSDGTRVYAGTFLTTKSSGAFSWPTIFVNKLAPCPNIEKKTPSQKTLRVPINRNHHGVDELDHRNNNLLKQAFEGSSRLIE